MERLATRRRFWAKRRGAIGNGLFAGGGYGLALALRAPLVMDLGGVLRGEAVIARDRCYEVLSFRNLLGEALKFFEVDSWMVEHFISMDCAHPG